MVHLLIQDGMPFNVINMSLTWVDVHRQSYNIQKSPSIVNCINLDTDIKEKKRDNNTIMTIRRTLTVSTYIGIGCF